MQDHDAAQPEQKVAARGLAGHAREELRVREGTLVINGANRNSKVNNTNNHNSAGDVGAQVR